MTFKSVFTPKVLLNLLKNSILFDVREGSYAKILAGYHQYYTVEKAFYDALTRPQAVKDFYTNEQLVELAKELTEMLRKNRTLDWNRRESERANMRRLVKQLLRKYKYPPERK